MKTEIELTVSIVNLTYLFRGLDAIRDLKDFCDEHASNVESESEVDDDAAVPPSPSVPLRVCCEAD